MEIGQRIKEYRTALGMTQEELADRLYITRQTVSNWENDRSYPDIHSLVMLSELFDVTLDTLVKGDIEKMKEKVNADSVRRFNKEASVYGILFLAMVITPVPLAKFLGIPGLVLWALIAAAALWSAVRVEKLKKQQDIQSFREIVAFMNGEKLDGIDKAREEGKRIYQKVALVLGSAVLGLLVGWFIAYVTNGFNF